MTTRSLPDLPLLPNAGAQPADPAPPTVRTLVDEFLAEQSRMTAVERFADAHDQHGASGEPAQARWYRDLLPTEAPGPGQQYAFDVDLDACSGCKACVSACHSLNGLDEGESWRDVGLLVGTGDNALRQPVTTACHHCTEPGCLDGCPVDAYEKDPDTGIVRHLDDQCIGCSYCTLTCPYEVPQFDDDRGIVRKCDMCQDRLQTGEAPACVQACPTEAIRITVVDVEDAGREGWGFAAPSPEGTRPTTRYRSSRDLDTDVAPVDRHTVRPREGHTPLVVMLVLTQLAVGTFTVLESLRGLGALEAGSAAAGALVSLGVTVLALVASIAHLGRPQYAWKAVIGLRHSWLSREIVAFGLFAPLGALHALVLGGWLPAPLHAITPGPLGLVAAATGLAAVGTSVMVYVATGREGWRAPTVTARFALTTGVLGCLVAASLGTLSGALAAETAARLVAAGVALVGLTLVMDLLPRRHGRDGTATTAGRTAALLRGPLAGRVQWRVALGLLAAMLGTAATLVLTGTADRAPAAVMLAGAVVAATAGELVARSWFFTAEGSPRMPGGPA